MQLKLGGSIDDNGKVTVFQSDELKRWINAHRGRAIVLSIKEKKKTRSNNQNSYYWGVVVPMITERLKELGTEMNDDRTHEFLKKQFNYEQIEVKDGHYIDVPLTTTDLETGEFMVYLEKIQQFAAQLLDIYIPDPNEQTELQFKTQQ